MKAKNLPFFLLIIFCLNIYSQDNYKFEGDKIYVFKYGLKLQECDAEGNLTSPNPTYANKGWEVRIDKVLKSDDKVIIYFIKWVDKNSPKLQKRNSEIVEKTVNIPAVAAVLDGGGKVITPAAPATTKQQRVYFYLSLDEFKKGLRKKKSAIDIKFGTATIPIKIRPGNDDGIPFDFNGNFNAGVGLATEFNFLSGLDIYTGISITSVPVDEKTTNGIVTSATNAGALTPTIGIIKDLGPVQVGGFIGFDFLSRELGENWIYQGRRWFGIGVGVNLFDISSGANKSDSQGGDD